MGGLRAVLRKDFLLKRRSPRTTLCQIFSPPLLASILVLAFSYSSKQEFGAATYAVLHLRAGPMLAAALDMGLDFRSPQPTMRGLDFGAQPTIRTQWDSLACRPESLVYDGRLEIFHAGEWGTFCTRSFGLNDAWVACGQMGLEPYVVDRSDCRFGLKAERRGSGKIWLSHMKCYGDEDMLSECGSTEGDPFSGSRGGLVWGAPDCQEDHSEDLGISCLAPNGETPRVLSGEGAVRFGWMQTRTAGERNDPSGAYKPCRAARQNTEVNRGRTCAETCTVASNGVCNDGGSGSEFSDCSLGTDCADCGPRIRRPPSPPGCAIADMQCYIDDSRRVLNAEHAQDGTLSREWWAMG